MFNAQGGKWGNLPIWGGDPEKWHMDAKAPTETG